MPATLTVTSGGQPVDKIRFGNRDRPGTPCVYTPERLEVTLDLGASAPGEPPVERVRLLLPRGWLSDRATERQDGDRLSWTVFPKEAPEEFTPAIAAELIAGEATTRRLSYPLGVMIEARSQFIPAMHVLPWANSTASLGTVEPRWDILRRTFALALLPHAFFRGLYRAMVHLDAQGGGLCSGLAHLALERSLKPTEAAPTIDDVLLWHGRQLSDRATLASAPWFLLPSPRRACRAFREQLLAQGRSDICFDIAQPSLRHPRLGRVLTHGHTVLPYGLRQESAERAEVLVYDPNDPAAAREDRSVISFDLGGDSYAYPGHVAPHDGTTIYAPRQRSYRGRRTTLLASLASLVLFPRSVSEGNGRKRTVP
ncbi:MAG TPA: hypothetical protein VFI42_15490 [Thermomicrobiaceae bacterium]|nr:hypothetical protein [Thermomicrobiaceae bacterium]